MHDYTRTIRAALAGLLLAAGLGGCGDPFEIPPASQSNRDRLLVLYALSGTPIRTASAFNMVTGLEVRTDRSSEFDFAIDFVVDSTLGLGTTGDTVVALLPAGTLGFQPDPGAQVLTGVAFDSVLLAPLDGYITDRAVRIDTGMVILVSSRSQGCNFGLVRHLYGKFGITEIDRAQRKITTRIVTNPNCGYRGLGEGIPTR